MDASIPPTAPDQIFFIHHVLQFLTVFVTVNAQQDKGLIGMFFNERPLVRVQFPAWASPMAPETEHHDLALILAQLESLTINILAFNVRRDPANRQVLNSEQCLVSKHAHC